MKAFNKVGKLISGLDLNKGVAAVIAAFGVLGSIIVGLVESAKGCKAEDDVVEGEPEGWAENHSETSEETSETTVESTDEPTDSDEK